MKKYYVLFHFIDFFILIKEFFTFYTSVGFLICLFCFYFFIFCFHETGSFYVVLVVQKFIHCIDQAGLPSDEIKGVHHHHPGISVF